MRQTEGSSTLELEATPRKTSRPAPAHPRPEPIVAPAAPDSGWDDASPFGLQALRRDELQLLKEDAISWLAMALSVRGTRAQIRDPQFVAKILSWYRDWVDDYQVVHLIERSLWINGHSDLVMTLTKNPSQIADNPPKAIMETLARAHVIHPQATIYYGVPLFGDEKTADGLPIPLTAAEVRAEHARRIKAAQTHALRWGWFYRALLRGVRFPAACGRFAGRVWQGGRKVVQGVVDYWKQMRLDSRRRCRAMTRAQMEYNRFGRSWTRIPEHTTTLGYLAAGTVELAQIAQHQIEQLILPATVAGMAGGGFSIASLIPTLIVPLTVIPCDPFLFIELPDEPSKLRFLGHWYWQGQVLGKQKLHLHV